MNDMTAVCSVQTEDCDEEFWMTEEVLKVGEPAPDFALKDDHGCVREPDGRWSASLTTMWRRTAGSVIITA